VEDVRKIMKFGGSSVGDGEKIKHVANIIKNHVQRGDKLVVVVSAMLGVTDSLIMAADRAKQGDKQYIVSFMKDLADRHQSAARKAIEKNEILQETLNEINDQLTELERVLTGVACLGELTPRSRDYILSFGEKLSTLIVYGALLNLGLRAKYFTGRDAGITTDSHFGEAKPLMNITVQQVNERLGPLLDGGVIPVVTGFIAGTLEGATTTLGRGSSDYTATILGAALNVDEVWIWTDVDGLMTADPSIEPSARTLPAISYSEAMEMAYFGAKVIYPKALEPVAEKGIPVRIKNTFNPENPGTLIIKEQQIKPRDIVKAISIIKNVALITVGGAGMMGYPGVAAKVFGILGEIGVNVLMISQSSSEANISFVIPRDKLEKSVNALEIALLGGGVVKEITSEADVCVVAAVGAGMRGTPGVAARVFQTVARENINIRMIAQGSSELNISFVVNESEGDKAVRALHREFISS
jgi:aspartate kinase